MKMPRRQGGCSPGHSDSPRSANAGGARTAARLRHCAPDRADQQRRAATQPGHSLSGSLRWSRKDGLPPSGERLRRTARRGFTPLLQPGGDGSPRRPRTGGACHRRLNASLASTRRAWRRRADELGQRRCRAARAACSDTNGWSASWMMKFAFTWRCRWRTTSKPA